jgi:hypothetical protein
MKRNDKFLLVLVAVFMHLVIPYMSFSQSPNEKQLVFSSTDTAMQQAFNWASEMALSYRGNPGDKVGPWYEAALPSRNAFCMRDVSHQAIGAEILGMNAENRNMFGWFSKSITESKDWCSYWEINKDAVPAPADYANDKEFWYNLNANFDVLYAQWRLFEWTGDRMYIDDAKFQNFQKRSVDEYIKRWTLQADSLITRNPHPNAPVPFDAANSFHVSRGVPSYSEGAGELIMGVDLVASIQRGLLTYATILSLQGDKASAESYRKRAAAYKSVLEKQWWDNDAQLYHTYYNTDKQFGKEEGETFLLWFDVLTDKSRRNKTLDHIESKQWNAENTSYLPWLFYKNGRWEKAKEYIQFLVNPSTKRREYPEVSYGVIDGLVHGLMGVSPSASSNTLTTLLCEPGNQTYKVSGLKLLQTNISLQHLGDAVSILTNTGNKGFTWRAAFAGSHKFGLINGKKVKMTIGSENGRTISYMSTYVKPGVTVKAQINQ